MTELFEYDIKKNQNFLVTFVAFALNTDHLTLKKYRFKALVELIKL